MEQIVIAVWLLILRGIDKFSSYVRLMLQIKVWQDCFGGEQKEVLFG